MYRVTIERFGDSDGYAKTVTVTDEDLEFAIAEAAISLDRPERDELAADLVINILECALGPLPELEEWYEGRQANEAALLAAAKRVEERVEDASMIGVTTENGQPV